MELLHIWYWIIWILFFYLNFLILKSDYSKKIIPNKILLYLLYSLPHALILYYLSGIDVSYTKIMIEILIAFMVSFWLYYYGVWSAWDAKYLLILALFVPHVWILALIWNISLITLAYLWLYFLYFYLFKSLINIKYWKSLFINIKNDLSEKLKYYLVNQEGIFNKTSATLKLIKVFIWFLILFVALRLSRIYLIDYFQVYWNDNIWNNQWLLGTLFTFAENNYSYIFFAWILLFIWLIFLLRKIYIKIRLFLVTRIKNKISNVTGINEEHIDIVFLGILGVWLCSFIYSQYLITPYEIKNSLKLIFTYYIAIWLLVKIFIYLYKVAFQVAEQDVIDIKDLKVWDIIDKPFLLKNFATEKCLWAYWNKKGILYPSPWEAIAQLDTPITKESLKLLKKIYKISNDHHKNENKKNFSPLETIKILKTFAFSWYIFIWFILTFLYWETIFQYIIDSFITILKSLYN